MKALRKQISREQFQVYNVPEDFAEEVEIIILAIKPLKKDDQITEDEAFYFANNNVLLDADRNEDMIWSKYI
ncbi:MAG: hypothetical protein WCO63_11570 [Bacteroidota bacterium]